MKALSIFIMANRFSERLYAPVAQLDRALACGAKGRTFESCRVYHLIWRGAGVVELAALEKRYRASLSRVRIPLSPPSNV